MSSDGERGRIGRRPPKERRSEAVRETQEEARDHDLPEGLGNQAVSQIAGGAAPSSGSAPDTSDLPAQGSGVRAFDPVPRDAATTPQFAALLARFGVQAGAPLDGAVRERMQRVFSADLGSVQIHADAAASRLTRALGARALAYGERIWFSDPSGVKDAQLLGHEIAHVLQQRRGRSDSGAASPRGKHSGGASLEREADRGGRAAVHGSPAGVRGSVGARVQRKPAQSTHRALPLFPTNYGDRVEFSLEGQGGAIATVVGHGAEATRGTASEFGSGGRLFLEISLQTSPMSRVEWDEAQVSALEAQGYTVLQRVAFDLDYTPEDPRDAGGVSHSMPRPTLADQSLDPRSLTGPELEAQSQDTQDWLIADTEPGRDQAATVEALAANDEVLAKKQAGVRLAADTTAALADLRRKHPHIADMFGSGIEGGAFAVSFAGALQYQLPQDTGEKLFAELAANPFDFYFGVQAGILKGAVEQLVDNIIGLAQLAKLGVELGSYLNPVNLALMPAKEFGKYIWYGDEYQPPWAMSSETQRILTALGALLQKAAQDPGFMTEQAGAFGAVLGDHLGVWFHEDFMERGPFYKGLGVGEVIGRVVLEVALLFLGPEEWVARGALALGQAARATGSLARAVRTLMRSVPELRGLLKAVDELGAGGKAAGGLLDEGGAAAKALPPPPAKAPAGGASVGDELGSATTVADEVTPPSAAGNAGDATIYPFPADKARKPASHIDPDAPSAEVVQLPTKPPDPRPAPPRAQAQEAELPIAVGDEGRRVLDPLPQAQGEPGNVVPITQGIGTGTPPVASSAPTPGPGAGAPLPGASVPKASATTGRATGSGVSPPSTPAAPTTTRVNKTVIRRRGGSPSKPKVAPEPEPRVLDEVDDRPMWQQAGDEMSELSKTPRTTREVDGRTVGDEAGAFREEAGMDGPTGKLTAKSKMRDSYDMGEEGGRRLAREQGIVEEPWDWNPKEFKGDFGQGPDAIGRARNGTGGMRILEFKGGKGSKLDRDQGRTSWVGRKIAQMKVLNDPMADRLLRSGRRGNLETLVYKTTQHNPVSNTFETTLTHTFRHNPAALERAYQRELRRLRQAIRDGDLEGLAPL